MGRRPMAAGAATAVVLLLLVLTAASGPARLWTAPTRGDPAPRGAAPAASTIDDDATSDDGGDPQTGSASRWLYAASLAVFAVVVIGGVASARRTAWPDHVRRVVARRRWSGTPLPRIGGRGALEIDLAAARSALHSGAPRNGIVACWQRLEVDAAAAGFERWESETSAEYVERVIAATSVDVAPIEELASLYREARFSSHPLDDRHRARAVEALHRVVQVLSTERSAAR